MPKKLFVASLQSNTRKHEVVSLFSQFGKVKRVELVSQKNSNRCKGFAFVTFQSEDDAIKVLNSKVSMNGRLLTIREQLKGRQLEDYKSRFKKRRMFVGDLPLGVTDADLSLAFGQLGEVEVAYLIKNHKTGENSSFGYVLFKEEGAVERALGRKIQVAGRLVRCERFRENAGSFRRDYAGKKVGGCAVGMRNSSGSRCVEAGGAGRKRRKGKKGGRRLPAGGDPRNELRERRSVQRGPRCGDADGFGVDFPAETAREAQFGRQRNRRSLSQNEDFDELDEYYGGQYGRSRCLTDQKEPRRLQKCDFEVDGLSEDFGGSEEDLGFEQRYSSFGASSLHQGADFGFENPSDYYPSTKKREPGWREEGREDSSWSNQFQEGAPRGELRTPRNPQNPQTAYQRRSYPEGAQIDQSPHMRHLNHQEHPQSQQQDHQHQPNTPYPSFTNIPAKDQNPASWSGMVSSLTNNSYISPNNHHHYQINNNINNINNQKININENHPQNLQNINKTKFNHNIQLARPVPDFQFQAAAGSSFGEEGTPKNHQNPRNGPQKVEPSSGNQIATHSAQSYPNNCILNINGGEESKMSRIGGNGWNRRMNGNQGFLVSRSNPEERISKDSASLSKKSARKQLSSNSKEFILPGLQRQSSLVGRQISAFAGGRTPPLSHKKEENQENGPKSLFSVSRKEGSLIGHQQLISYQSSLNSSYSVPNSHENGSGVFSGAQIQMNPQVAEFLQNHHRGNRRANQGFRGPSNHPGEAYDDNGRKISLLTNVHGSAAYKPFILFGRDSEMKSSIIVADSRARSEGRGLSLLDHSGNNLKVWRETEGSLRLTMRRERLFRPRNGRGETQEASDAFGRGFTTNCGDLVFSSQNELSEGPGPVYAQRHDIKGYIEGGEVRDEQARQLCGNSDLKNSRFGGFGGYQLF